MTRISRTNVFLLCLLAMTWWKQTPKTVITTRPSSLSFTSTSTANNFHIDDATANPQLLRGNQNANDSKVQSAFLAPSRGAAAFTSSSSSSSVYESSFLERYVLDHASELHYQGRRRNQVAPGCEIWKNETSTPEIYQGLHQFYQQLQDYHTDLHAFNGSFVRDLRTEMTTEDKSICDSLELHPNGLRGLFPNNILSNMPGTMGYMEPLLTPLRHPKICFEGRSHIMNMDYMVHDFASMCRHALHPNSRTVFVDMGASLDFHGKSMASPAVYITHLYQRFGFHLDHIYAYEITPKNATDVYLRIPDDLKAAYHWYNVGVSADITSTNNPLKLLLENYNQNDFVIVKLDIDTPFIENPMAQYLATDERLHDIIDAFYFEHHVFLEELAPSWGLSMHGSVKQSLELFSKLREKGIAAHYWP